MPCHGGTGHCRWARPSFSLGGQPLKKTTGHRTDGDAGDEDLAHRRAHLSAVPVRSRISPRRIPAPRPDPCESMRCQACGAGDVRPRRRHAPRHAAGCRATSFAPITSALWDVLCWAVLRRAEFLRVSCMCVRVRVQDPSTSSARGASL